MDPSPTKQDKTRFKSYFYILFAVVVQHLPGVSQVTLGLYVCLIQCQDGEKLERRRSYRHLPRSLQMCGQVSVLDGRGSVGVGVFEHPGNNSCFPVMWAAMRMLWGAGKTGLGQY